MNLLRWIWLRIPIIRLRKAKIYKRIRCTRSCDENERKAWGVDKDKCGYFGGRLVYIGGRYSWVPDGKITRRKRCGDYTDSYRQALRLCSLLAEDAITA